jgi:hypothetical protein
LLRLQLPQVILIVRNLPTQQLGNVSVSSLVLTSARARQTSFIAHVEIRSALSFWQRVSSICHIQGRC